MQHAEMFRTMQLVQISFCFKSCESLMNNLNIKKNKIK